MNSPKEVSSILSDYKLQIEDKISQNLSLFGLKTKLRDACEYALLNGGKRFRPALVLLIAKAVGNQLDATYGALAIEFFHTASLIADDLPCMDDDDERRNKPSLHKVCGEAMALLVSYGLIAAGYECLSKNAEVLKLSNSKQSENSDRACVLALENATYNTGFLGATGGQFLDIFPPDLSENTLREIIKKKTVSLFEVSFVLGWLFGGGDHRQLDLVKKAALHFGMAFQIVDDLGDVEQDTEKKRYSNMAVTFGVDKAKEMLKNEFREFAKVIKELHLKSNEIEDVAKSLHDMVF